MIDLVKELEKWYDKIDKARTSSERIGQLFTLKQILDELKGKKIIIAESRDVVIVLDREEGQMMIEEFAKHEMLLPANILISIRQQLEEGK